jgi:hypothetical protein
MQNEEVLTLVSSAFFLLHCHSARVAQREQADL